MKLSEFYTPNASDQWFSSPTKGGSIHQRLAERDYSVLSQTDFLANYPDLSIPLKKTELSWGSILPSPLTDFETTFIAKYHFEFRETEFNGKLLSEISNELMRLMPGSEKYLVSLNDSDFLFSVTDKVEFEDVFIVAIDWDIDCYIGVFDSSQKMCFVFDAEFGIAYFSFHPDYLPDGIQEFTESFNSEFEREFVQNGKFRTGADPERIAEYYEKVVLPANRS